MNAIKRFIQRMINIFGYKLVSIERNLENDVYTVLQPKAKYSPWNENKDFLAIYQKIQQNTLVDIYRCYELFDLLNYIKNDGIILEIGVWRGGTGALIASKLKLDNRKNKVYLFDTFEGIVKASDIDDCYNGGEHSDTNEYIVKKLVDDLNLDNTIICKGIFPDQTSHLLPNEPIAFCHIDVDVYNSAKDIFNFVWSKMLSGGIVVFDDYGFITTKGVTLLVNELKKQDDLICLYNLNGHAVFIKK